MTLPGGEGRPQGSHDRPPVAPISGEPLELASALRAFAAEGVGHVQLVLDPITVDSIRGLAPALALLDD